MYMITLPALLTYTISLLSIIVIGMGLYAWRLRRRVHKLARQIPASNKSARPIDSEQAAAAPIMQYSEFKNRYGSRSRDIAIVSSSNHPAAHERIQEFTNAIREHGSLLYHFTYYIENGHPAKLQEKINTAVREDNFHAFLSIGTQATRILRHATSNQSKMIPTVFACIRDTWWHAEQEKHRVLNMTGVTGVSGWKKRIKFYVSD